MGSTYTQNALDVRERLNELEYLNLDNDLTGDQPTGGGIDDVFFENAMVVRTDYEITAGKSGMSAGDIVIDAGVTVTVPVGSSWVIV